MGLSSLEVRAGVEVGKSGEAVAVRRLERRLVGRLLLCARRADEVVHERVRVRLKPMAARAVELPHS